MHLKIVAALVWFGFKHASSDHNMFVHTTSTTITVLLVYVDDMVLAGNDTKTIDTVKQFLASQFKIKDLGHLKYFLGIELARSSTGIYLHYNKYTQDLLSDVALKHCKPSPIPLEQNHSLLADTHDQPDISDFSLYRRVIGRLIYLTILRPDIGYTVNTLAQFMGNPKDCHYQATMKLLKYLKGTCGQGILLSVSNSFKLTAYCDAD